MTPFIVAIDGPAGAGKSTVAKRVAVRAGLSLVDTGAIYRTLALLALREHVSVDDEEGLAALAATIPDRLRFAMAGDHNQVWLDDSDVSEDIRTAQTSSAASLVSRHPAVRSALLGLQRALGHRGAGAVLEGRDIGTVVFPDATLKAFVTASPAERARRRVQEFTERGVHNEAYDKVLADIIARDKQDAERPVAPLKPAADAVWVDTTGKSLDQVVDELMMHVQQRRQV
jgi:CMP/dCMP kinase